MTFNDGADFPKIFLGKPVVKGDKKGTLSYVVREDVTLIPCTLHESFEQYVTATDLPTKELPEVEIVEEESEASDVWIENTSGDIRDGM